MSDSTQPTTSICDFSNPKLRGCYQVEISVPGQATRVVELTAGKCTIGSSPSCQIRLEASAVRPLHCLLVAAQDSLTATQWAPGVCVNGQEFSSTSLALGDCLSIGEVELRITQASQPDETCTTQDLGLGVPTADEHAVEMADNDSEHSAVESDPVELVNQIEESLQAIDGSTCEVAPGLSLNISRQRCRRLITSLREFKSTRSELKAELEQLNAQLLDSQTERDSLQYQLAELQSNSQEFHLQHAAEVERMIEELSASFSKSSDLENSLTELTDRHEQLEGQTLALSQELEELKQALTEARAENQDLHAQVEVSQARFAELEKQHAEAQEAMLATQNICTEQSQAWEFVKSEFDALQSEHLCLQAEHDKFKEEAASRQHELDNTNQVVLGMEETQKYLEKSLADQAARFVEMEQDVMVLQTERDSLIEQKKTCEQRIAQTEKEIELLRIDAKSAATDRQQSLDELNKARGSQKETEQKCVELESQLERLQRTSAEESTPVGEATEEIANLRSELDSHKRLLNEAAAELDKLRDSARHFDDDRSLLAESINTRDEHIAELEAALKHSHDQLAQCAFQAEQLNKAYEEVLLELSFHQQERSRPVECDDTPELVATKPEIAEWEPSAEEHSVTAPEEPSQEQSPVWSSLAEVPQEESVGENVSPKELDWLVPQSTQEPVEEPAVEAPTAFAPEMPDEPPPALAEDLPPASESIEAAGTEATTPQPHDDEWGVNFANSVRSFYEAEAQEEPAEQPAVSLELDRESGVEEEPQEEQEFQPTSFIDQYSHMFEENAESSFSSTPPRAPIAGSPAESHLAADDDAALDEYMANLMRRVRGESSTEAITPPISNPEVLKQEHDPVKRMEELASRVSNSTLDVSEEVENPLDLEDLKQFSKKPPLTADLRAMRELANSSARTAIATHRKQRYMQGALGKFMVSGIAAGASAFMTLSAESYTSPYFLGGCAVGIVSVFWGVKLLGVLLEAIREGSARKSTPAELSDRSAPLPIDV